MDPYDTDVIFQFQQGDRIALGNSWGLQRGTLISSVLDSDVPVWLVQFDDGVQEAIEERLLRTFGGRR